MEEMAGPAFLAPTNKMRGSIIPKLSFQLTSITTLYIKSASLPYLSLNANCISPGTTSK